MCLLSEAKVLRMAARPPRFVVDVLDRLEEAAPAAVVKVNGIRCAPTRTWHVGRGRPPLEWRCRRETMRPDHHVSWRRQQTRTNLTRRVGHPGLTSTLATMTTTHAYYLVAYPNPSVPPRKRVQQLKVDVESDGGVILEKLGMLTQITIPMTWRKLPSGG